MAHKTLTISEEAYKLLAEEKLEGESFTETIKRIIRERGKRPLQSHAGTWVGTDEELKTIFRELDSAWRGYEKRLEGS